MNRYGLLGHKLSHSLSPVIHNYLFKKNNIDGIYELIEIEEEMLPLYVEKVRNGTYIGLNVTIPYKEKIIPYLDELSQASLAIGAVNTIYLKDGKVIGDNTDYLGFIDELNEYNINVKDKNVYILGSGGASKAISYAMKILGANPIIVSRDNSIGITYDELKDIKHYSLIINTTPVGMYPNCDKEILDKDTVLKSDLCVDIICNPKVTKLLEYAKEGYNGILMLVFQAIRAEILWQEKEIKYDLKELLELL